MNIKQRLRDWLEVKDPIEQRDWEAEFKKYADEYAKKSTIAFERIVNQMHPVNCINCSKLLIAGRDPVYTNFKGQKFCSHTCIDEYDKQVKGTKNAGKKEY